MTKIAVFASGSGSNFQAIVEAVRAGDLHVTIEMLICDQPEAFCVTRAEELGVPALTFRPKDYPSKTAYEADVLAALREKGVEWIVLAGYMRLIGPALLEAYANRIMNIHPSLLPAFPGKDAVGQAIAAGVKVSGVTIHYVDAGMDTGPIIAQEAITIEDGDTAARVHEKIQQVEHRLYPFIIEKVCN
ncbi:phosphoribosylglycinamide formyltransferase [Pradoshia sp.]